MYHQKYKQFTFSRSNIASEFTIKYFC